MESMRHSTLALSAACLGLVAALAYVVRGFHDERARSREQTAELSELRARLSQAGEPHAAPEAPAAATQPEEPAPRSEPAEPAEPEPEANSVAQIDDLAKSEDEARALRRMQADQGALAKSLADPASRAKLRAEAIAEVRRNSPDLARALGLKPQQETQLVELLADQQLQMRASSPRDQRQLYERHEEELRALLGSEQVESFRQYRSSAPERAQMQALRARLGDTNALREDQATRLVALMRKEREAYVAGLTQSGAGGYLGEYPFTPFSSGDDPVEEIKFAEAQLSRTEEFLGRIRDKAATVLTREQLRSFTEIQEEQMASERRRIEWLRSR
jgi:hypothetical protein